MPPADAARDGRGAGDDRVARGDGHGDEAVGGFVDAVLAVVADIPPGMVATYGDVAALLGSRGARAVGQTMARYGADVPWWRVVRAGGRPPTGHAERARAHYEREGTPLVAVADDDGYRLDLAACRWRP